MELSTAPKPVGYLRQHQIEDLNDDRKYLEAQLKDPNIQEKADVAKALRRLNNQIDTQTAPILSPEGRDAADSERLELEEFIRDGMCSEQEMSRNPNGAVGKKKRHQAAKMDAMLRLKDIMLMLHPGSTDPDLCSMERLRPMTSTLGMHDVQIDRQPYHFAPPTDDWRKKFDDTFGGATPEQVQERQQSLESSLVESNRRLDANDVLAEEAILADSGPADPADEPEPDSGGEIFSGILWSGSGICNNVAVLGCHTKEWGEVGDHLLA